MKEEDLCPLAKSAMKQLRTHQKKEHVIEDIIQITYVLEFAKAILWSYNDKT